MNNKKTNNIYFNPKDAGEYFNHIQTNPINLKEQKIVKALLPTLHGKNCLEIGCAGAIYSREMLNQNALKVDSMDNSPVMIEMAQKKTETNVKYYHEDINSDLNLTNTYDFICASYVLHYSKELDKTLTNIIQLLNPQGILIISVPNPKQFKQGENQLFLGDNEMKTRFYNHSQTAYLVTLKTFGTVVKTKENEDVFIVKFQKA